RDPRIKAVFAISPIDSIVLGPEGMSQIQIPTMIMGGSSDFVASVLQEQIHPFTWLTTPDKYLAITIPSGHTYADATDGGAAPAPGSAGYLLSGPDPELGREYVRELSLAMMQTYVAHRPEYEAYLTPAYVESISQEPLQIDFVRSLIPSQLEQAFGRTPPFPIVPPPLVADVPSRSQPILEEIAKTGVLRAAVRQDAAPFGYVDRNGQQTGFCVNLLNALATDLGEQLQTPVRLDIAAISTPETRFDLVKNETVQVECGPNTIRTDIDGITFSSPFFVTGAHLLVRSTEAPQIDPFSPLPDRRIGVLRGTTTETFVQQRYPNANIVRFGGIDGRTEGIEALAAGQLDAFAGDGILSLGTLQQLNLPRSDFALLPDRPMTCEPYGLILPNNDRQFQTIVDDFIASPTARAIWDQQFSTDASRYIFF
ncbi:MAG TPA: transporter substrate-binding domain-containing protein, partial [Allocoleopsis sp.]